MTMHLSCTVMEIWRLKCWTHGRGHGKKDGRMEKERERGSGEKEKGKWKRKMKGKKKEKGKEVK